MIRRGNTFSIRGQAGYGFVYGDPGDTVLVSDWDGNGSDTDEALVWRWPNGMTATIPAPLRLPRALQHSGRRTIDPPSCTL
jgi:hypothetical protein